MVRGNFLPFSKYSKNLKIFRVVSAVRGNFLPDSSSSSLTSQSASIQPPYFLVAQHLRLKIHLKSNQTAGLSLSYFRIYMRNISGFKLQVCVSSCPSENFSPLAAVKDGMEEDEVKKKIKPFCRQVDTSS